MTQSEILEKLGDDFYGNVNHLASLLASMYERIEALEGKKKCLCETTKDGFVHSNTECPYIDTGSGKGD